MADYPSAIYSPRTKANKAGIVYDAAKTTVLFADDVVNDDNEIVAIETELGTDPAGSDATVKARLNRIDAEKKGFVCIVVEPATDLEVADGQAFIQIPSELNTMLLSRATASVQTAGTTNATTIDIYNLTDTVDMLSGAISIASGGTVATPGTIDTDYDDVATDDILRIDITTVSTTPPKGLVVVLEFVKA